MILTLQQARDFGFHQEKDGSLVVRKAKVSVSAATNLLSRLTEEDGGFGISDKTVSRIHMILEVESVSNQQCVRYGVPEIQLQAYSCQANARSRSQLTLEDKNTKIGTLLNGEQIRGTKVTLQKDDNIFTLGKYKHAFRYVVSIQLLSPADGV
jgi:pSer/pThr/pTyr-binding forkhead associated (FHA) protein